MSKNNTEVDSIIQNLDRQNCPDSKRINSYVLGKISFKEAKDIKKHLKECPLCSEEYNEYQKIMETDVQQEMKKHFEPCKYENVKLPQKLIQQISKEPEALEESRQIVYEPETADKHAWSLDFMVAAIKKYLSVRWVPAGLAFAAIMILIVLGKGLLDSPNLEEQRRLFAANSTPSPFMESLLGLSQRAANVTEVSPSNGFNVRNNLLFSWKRDEASELSIIILNNREEELLTFSTTGNEYLFEDAADQLPPGLYYWKLEDKNELKHVGKFFVNKP